MQVIGAPRPIPQSCDRRLVSPLLAEPAILPEGSDAAVRPHRTAPLCPGWQQAAPTCSASYPLRQSRSQAVKLPLRIPDRVLFSESILPRHVQVLVCLLSPP